VGSGVSPRDFVNLRHWQIVKGVYVSAAASITHPTMPVLGNYVRLIVTALS
jgi:START domain